MSLPAYAAATAMFERSKGHFPFLTMPLGLNVAALTGTSATVRLADLMPNFPDVVHAPRRARPAPIHLHVNITITGDKE